MTVWVEMFEAKVALELSTPLKEKHIKHSVVGTDSSIGTRALTNSNLKFSLSLSLILQNVSEFWTIPLVLEELVDIVPELSVKKVFNLKDFDSE